MSTYLAVAFNLPVRKLFWYKASSSFRGEFQIGQRVVAPFRNKNLKGFIAEISEKHPGGKLKEIESIFDKTSPFSIFLIRLAFWMADYYACSLGQVFHSIFPFSYPYDGEDEQTEDGKEKSSNSKEPLVYVVNPGEDRFFFFSDLIKKTLSQQKKALILVPEIGLIDGFQKRLQKHGISSMIFHSKLPSKERYRRWIAMKKGEVDVVVGTRSGVFAPLKEIGLILVDQEESLEYKQKETPKYSVHKVALKRGEIEGFPVYLSTYSPSLDSWYKVKTKKYRKISVKSEKKSFLEVVVDLKKEPKKNRIFSGILQEKIKEALEEKSSILLFVPRRGYASFLLCDDCGEVIRCPDCSITLNFHLGREMVCHWCGFRKKAPSLCPFCEGRDLRKIGWGTQKVEMEAKKRFPRAKVKRFDLDIFKSSGNISSKIRENKVDILVGTQLLLQEEIISKVSVVCVMLMDVLLNLPDFRATEHAFHLLKNIKQNLKENATLVVQTYNPHHYLFKLDEEKFYQEELRIRKALSYPPFQRWIRILLEGKDKDKVKEKSQKIAKLLKNEDINYLGPSPCPLFKVKGNYRYHIILRHKKEENLPHSLLEKISSEIMRGSIKGSIDVDPLFIM